METFPGSNVSLDGTIDWEGARTDHNGGNTLGSMFAPREITTDEQCLGGSSNDVAHCVKPTDDGGYIVAGYSLSTDGDASGSGNHGGGDAWIIKYSSSGSIMWQKCYGGSEWDCAFSIDQTADGGYIFAGVTRSSDGDVRSRFSKTETDEDIWVVKLSPSGAIVREQYIGDYGTERAVSVCNAGDGYAVAAYTDYSTFVIKLDTTFTPTWSRYYGEGGDSSITSIIRASDGNYVCAGYTAASGGDTEGNHGGYDAWVMKLDPNGEPLWHRCVGGTSVDRAYSIQQTAAGSYLVAGGTRSNSGDLAGKNPSYNDCCWVFRLDGTGNTVEWQYLINNGAYGCWGRSARVSSDAGYIVAGYVYYTSQNYNGFVAKFDSSGTLSWVRSPGGSGPDYMYSVCEANGSYVAAGENNSYNTPGNHGGTDAFVARISGDVTPSPSPSPTTKQLTIENVKAEPEGFMPPDESTTISAKITAKQFQVDSIQWQVKINDQTETVVRSFPVRSSSGAGPWSVIETWDGKNDSGEYVPCNEYKFVIKTSATSDGDLIEKEATGNIGVVPEPPEIIEATFDKEYLLTLIDDEGQKMSSIHYQKKGNEDIFNPVALAPSTASLQLETVSVADSLTGKSLTTEVAYREYPYTIKFERPKKQEDRAWHCKFHIEDDEATPKDLLSPVFSEFDLAPKENSKIVTVKFRFACVREIDFIKVKEFWTTEINGKQITKEKSKLIKDRICIGVENPTGPLKGHKAEINRGLNDIACHLAEYTDFSSNIEMTKIKSRGMVCSKLYEWLKRKKTDFPGIAKEFTYNVDSSHYDDTTNIFDYADFMNPRYGPKSLTETRWEGDCRDVAALYALCCEAIGVEMSMTQLRKLFWNFEIHEAESCGTEEYIEGLGYVTTMPRAWFFPMHQFGSMSPNVWDPCLKYTFIGCPWPQGFLINVNGKEYQRTAIKDGMDTTAFWVQFDLADIKWPKYKWP